MHRGCFGLLIALTLLISGCHQPEAVPEPIGYSADAQYLIEMVEAVHPAFTLQLVPEHYPDKKAAYLEAVEDDMDEDTFYLLTRAFLTIFQDGHTKVEERGEAYYLDISWQAKGGRLLLAEDLENPLQLEIDLVGGISPEVLFQTIDLYFPAENDAARERNHTLWSHDQNMISLAGGMEIDGKIPIHLKGDPEDTFTLVSFSPETVYTFYEHKSTAACRQIGDVCYIDFNVCEIDDELEAAADRIKELLQAGVTKVILDVRDNPGGNSDAGKLLLEALGMRPPSYGAYVRYSPLAKAQRDYRKNNGSEEFAVDLRSAAANPEVDLVVLTNENTYSSAMMLGAWVQDGKLGTIIGQTSANAPSSYGDIIYCELPYSGISLTISHKRFLRPDSAAPQNELRPEIWIEPEEDSLQTAIDYLENRP